MKRFRWRDYFTISSYSFGLNYLWNSMHTIILPAVLLQFVPDALKGTSLGALTFVGLILAMVLQPATGALSDHTRSPWGRRRPWILAGAAGSILSLLVLGLAPTLGWLAAGYLLLQITSNFAHGPFQGFIPDLVPPRRHGVASGIRNLLDLGGLLAGVTVAGFAIDRGRPAWALAGIVAVLTTTAILTLLGVNEQEAVSHQRSALGGQRSAMSGQQSAGREQSERSRPAAVWARVTDAVVEAYRFDYRRYSDYAWLLVSRFLVLLGIFFLQGFSQYYLRDVFGVARPATMTARLTTIIGAGTFLLVFPAGYLSDRFGRKWANLIAALLCSAGVFLFLLVHSYAGLLAAGGIVGVGLGTFLSCNWALATDLVPAEQAGKYLGLSNLATAGAGATARLGGPFIDLFNAAEPGRGYTILMAFAGFSILAGALIIWRKVREPARDATARPTTMSWPRMWRLMKRRWTRRR